MSGLDIVDTIDQVLDPLVNAPRGDPILLIEEDLLVTPSISLTDCFFHRLGHTISIEDGTTINMAGSASHGLYERSL